MKRYYYVGDDGSWFVGLLFLIFLTLKLAHVVDWSWWWITSPLWIPVSVVVVAFAVVVLVHIIWASRD